MTMQAAKHLWWDNRGCHKCSLRGGCSGPVPGWGDRQVEIMIVGDSPGQSEGATGRLFPIDSYLGKRFDTLLDLAGLTRADVWVTNTVKCSTPTGKASAANAAICTDEWLEKEIKAVRPKLVITMGSAATAFFLGSGHSLDDVHGIPVESTRYPGMAVIPTYSIGAGMAISAYIPSANKDFMDIGRFIKGEQISVPDAYPFPSYEWIDDIEDSQWTMRRRIMQTAPLLSVDIELVPPYSEYEMFCFSITYREGEAYALPPTPSNLAFLHDICGNADQKKVFHNLIGVDLRTLRKYNIPLVNYDDTMIRAYLLSWSPQSLKSLSRRRLGMYMREYDEIMRKVRRPRALEYLGKVLDHEWQNPDPVVEQKWNAKTTMLEQKIKQPQNITTKVKKKLKKAAKENDYDIWSDWYKVDEGERSIVEAVIGVLPDVSLADVAEIEGWDDVIWYAARDADATLRLYYLMQREAERLNMVDLADMDLGAIPMATDMMDNGFGIDVPHFQALAAEWAVKIAEAEAIAWESVGKRFLISSPAQVAHILYKDLKFKPPGRGKKIISTDDDAITALKEKYDHPVLDAISTHRKFSKLRNTYATVLPRVADERGRVHTTLKLTRTATGRLSSAEPVNLMNQPVRGTEAKRIREGFIAEEGYVLLAVDLSQIEMRYMAHMSGDPTMIQIFRDGKDLHRATAAEVRGVAIEEINAEQRQTAKEVNFGLIYGETAVGLAHALNCSIAQAQRYLDQYLNRFPYVQRWMMFTKAHAELYGWVEDMMHRRRYIPEMLSTNKYVVESGLKQALNMPIQSSAQIPIKTAMWKLRLDFEQLGILPYVRAIIQIHDELLFEVREDLWKTVLDLVKWRMETAHELVVPVLAEGKMGKRWGNMKPLMKDQIHGWVIQEEEG